MKLGRDASVLNQTAFIMKLNVLILYSISQTGAMRLGRDALVLTQTANSRSIAFLSQSLNEGKDV